MNELIKINPDTKAVSARELYVFLEIQSKFADWIKNRIAKYGFIENQDFVTIEGFSKNLEKGGRPEIDYALTLDCAKELAMVEGNEKGKQARQYFIECEKALKQPKELSRKEMILLMLEQEEAKERLALQCDNLNTVLDNLLEWVSIIKVSQHNKIPETSFNWRLLKAKSIELGYAIKKAQSNRFNYQNLYNVTVYKACYPQYKYDLRENKQVQLLTAA